MMRRAGASLLFLAVAACLTLSVWAPPPPWSAADEARPAGPAMRQRIIGRARGTHMVSSSHTRRPRHSLPVAKSFVYVYEMPEEFTDEITTLPVQWHPEQYDFDQVLHKHLLQSEVRTTDAEEAQLFFIPVYLGRHYNWFWQQYSQPGNAWDVSKECKPEHTGSQCWWEKWIWAKEATSELVRKALAHVKESHPYWARVDGADHFMVFSYDHARCDMALTLRAEELGQLFSVQSYGDLTLTNTFNTPPIIQRLESGYDWDGCTTWACYRPNADVLLPMYYKYAAADIVSPFAGPRNISMLLRFDYKAGDGKNLVEHYGHRLRKELLDFWAADPLPGSQAGARTTEETEADMGNSVFCVCPPGATQDSTRVWRAILKGCIPVTFFRANDLPFARHLGVPYAEFILNLQLDDYKQVNDAVAHFLSSPVRLRRMQEALEQHQRLFLWDASEEHGVLANFERELALRVLMLKEPRSVFS